MDDILFNQWGILAGATAAVPQLLYPEATPLSGIFLKKMPPSTKPEGTAELLNQSRIG
jgi:hypothetical protein